MKKLERLVEQFNDTQNKISSIVEKFAKAIVFKGFEENYGGNPEVTYSTDGIMIDWGGTEMFADEIIGRMNENGYICPADFRAS